MRFKKCLFQGLHKKLNTFLKGRAILSLEKALGILLIFLSNHNEKLSGKRYLKNCLPYVSVKKFCPEDLENFGLILKQSSEEMVDDGVVCHFQENLIDQIVEKVVILDTIQSEISCTKDTYKPLEILLNCNFEGVPTSCDENCSESDNIGAHLDIVNREIDDSVPGNNLIDVLTFLDSNNECKTKSGLFEHLKIVMANQISKLKSNGSLKSLSNKVRHMQISDVDNESCSLILQAFAIANNIIIIVVSCSRKKMFQMIYPDTDLWQSSVLVISHIVHSNLYFGTRKKQPDAMEVESVIDCSSQLGKENTQEKECKCSCGRGRKRTRTSCSDYRCPCFAKKQKCSKCRCFECGNQAIIAAKSKPCRCGESNPNSNLNCKKLRCSCYKNKWSCSMTPLCLCKSCENNYGRKTSSSNQSRVAVTETERKKCKANAGKLPHLEKGSDFYESMGLEKRQSIWSNTETCALFICQREIEKLKCPAKLSNLYNQVKEKGLAKKVPLRNKSKSQVLSKLRNMNAYDGIYDK